MKFDLLMYNGSIVTVDESNPRARWAGIKDGKIEAVGSNSPPLMQSIKNVDLDGATLLPGLIDSHVHGTLTGLALKSSDLSEAKSKKQVLEAVSRHQSRGGTGNMVTAVNLAMSTMSKNEIPSAKELDEISSTQIIILFDKSLHGMVLNSLGIQEAGLQSGMVGVELENGHLTGTVTDDTSYYQGIRNLMKDSGEELLVGFQEAVCNEALKKGITSIHSLDGGDFVVDMPGWVINRKNLPINVVNYWETMDFEEVTKYGLSRIGGCICLDGTRALHTMALFEPYRDRPSTRGFLYYSDDVIYQFIKEAHEKDMQCALHATGERAIDQHINILKQVILEQGDKDLRHRIEHFSMPTEKHIEWAVEMNLALPMQPSFSMEWDEGAGSLYKTRFGKERASRVEPLSKIVRSGGKVCGGSDSPVTKLDSLYGIDACVNNPDPSRRIPLMEAIRSFTINNAWAAHEDDVRGSIEVGKVADLVLLDMDLEKTKKSVQEASTRATFVKGNLAYENMEKPLIWSNSK